VKKKKESKEQGQTAGAESRRQKAKGRRQKAEGGKQKSESNKAAFHF
jgi:hypothetical protein